MADDEARPYRIFAADDVDIGAANGGESDANNRFTRAGLRNGDFFESNFVYAAKDERFHDGGRG